MSPPSSPEQTRVGPRKRRKSGLRLILSTPPLANIILYTIRNSTQFYFLRKSFNYQCAFFPFLESRFMKRRRDSNFYLVKNIVNKNVGSVMKTYRTWSIKRCGAYFIFSVIGAVLIREWCLFQLRLKHWGEYRENKVRCVLGVHNSMKLMDTSNCYMNLVSRVS